MNYPYLHLLVNHLPIVGALAALLLLAWGIARHSRDVTRAALGAAVIAGLLAYPAYFSGDEAHEQLEEMPGYDHDRTHEHEEAAEGALVALLVTAGLGVVALWVSRGGRAIPVWAAGAVGLSLLVSSGLVIRAAKLGGEIVHLEARQPLTAPPTAAGPAAAGTTAPAPGEEAGAGTTHRHDDGTEHEH